MRRRVLEVPRAWNQNLEEMTYYLLVRRRPQEIFLGSSLFVGSNLAEAKKHIVEEVFGSGFPCTDDEILERYNVDVVELDEDWEKKLDDLADALCRAS